MHRRPETTKAQYTEFLAAAVDPDRSGACGFNDDHDPLPSAWNATTDDKAAVGMDWCDARDYCAWAGKRLCGNVGGGAVPYGVSSTMPHTSEWYQACSQGGVNAYPYGNVYDSSACTFYGASNLEGNQSPPGSHPACVIEGTGVVDMLGNVAEWIDGCDMSGATRAQDPCMQPSGPWYYNAPDLSYLDCDYFDPDVLGTLSRGTGYKAVGLRCCAD